MLIPALDQRGGSGTARVLAYAGAVVEALRRGRRCHIVHHDWFEFSTVWENKEPEAEYSMRRVLAERNAAKREQARVERGKKEGERFVNTSASSFSSACLVRPSPLTPSLGLFHIYQDREFFPYQIDLTRDGDDTSQRYTLCVSLKPFHRASSHGRWS